MEQKSHKTTPPVFENLVNSTCLHRSRRANECGVRERHHGRLLTYFVSQNTLAITPPRGPWRPRLGAHPARPPRPAPAVPCRAAAGSTRGKHGPGGRYSGRAVPLVAPCGEARLPETGPCLEEGRYCMKTPGKKSAKNSRFRPGTTGVCEAQLWSFTGRSGILHENDVPEVH